MKKIFVFTPSLNIGGIERILITYAKGLTNKGYSVTYLCLSTNGDFKFEEEKNLNFEDLKVRRLRWSILKLANFFKNNQPDIVLCANNATMAVYLAKLLTGLPIKIITSQHNYYENYVNIDFKSTFVPKYIYPRCEKIIAVSDGIREMLIKDFNIQPSKVVTISNPIDIEYIELKSLDEVDVPDEYILFVGRFDKVKNIPFLIYAFKLFNQNFPEVKLLLIGDGSELEVINQAIELANLKNEVKLLGKKSNPFPYIKRSKIVVLSSMSEAFPTVLLESLSLGKTVVSTPTYGAIDILKQGKYGYLSNSIFDVISFSNKLVEAYLHPFKPEQLEAYAILNFHLDSKLNELEKLWK